MAVGEALRRLCEEIGWSYAVFWKAIGAADPVHLVWEDGYCGHTPCPAGSEASQARATELGCSAAVDSICSLVRKDMAEQVHVVGEGTIGRVAFTGTHQWIIHGTADDHGLSSEVASEMHYQFRAGIKTIAIIPVLPRGVLQLGSTGVVMENTSFVMHAKKLCSQLNQRSSMAVSASVKSTSNQSRPLHGASNIQAADSSFSQFPVIREQYRRADSATASSSKSLNASLFEAAQQNGLTAREHLVYSKPNDMFVQQPSYCVSRLGSNTQSAAISSDLIPSSLASVEQQQMLMNTIGQLEFGSGTDLARSALLKSLLYRNPFMHDTSDMKLSHGRVGLSHGTAGHGSYGFLPGSAGVVSTTLCTSSQVSEQGSHSSSGMLRQKQPPVSCNVPQSSEFTMKMVRQEGRSSEGALPVSSQSDVQISNCLNGISQENLLSRSGHMHKDQNTNRANDPHVAVSTQGVKNMDACMLPGMPGETAHSLLLQPTWDNDLFDIFGSEFHQLGHNVDANLVSSCDAKSHSLDRDATEPSICLDSSSLFSSLDNDFPCSGIFSLTNTDQLLDAVISNVNPSSKQSSDDNASCKTALTDIPNICHFGLEELKQCDSSGIPSTVIKNESAQIVKQPYYFDKTEDGCHSQNNGAQKSQIRLWIENGQNMKCESASASNSKGLDAPSKSNRKRSRPGESSKARPKDRQLIQDRIKELREMVPNGAKCSIDALLEKTVKHMLFLQSVTKHADKLKDSTESKILGSENGPVWKDYFEGGATWAFDVGSQSMTCPIIVEDLDRPRQMLVEMICEDRGIFLEIADFIKGLGLTILRGVMEARKSKIWARFTVEANRDVTRMEIFLSLVRLLEPNCDGSGAAENPGNSVNMPLGLVHQPVIPATGGIQ
ncbi:transcription factor LHW-like isoform X2 [Hordeum vulgare subsp. vulgare]|uniref:Predicted protein n=1 Tax=Hordeum vulgare subsp. vulgare TaxID=112509 RepID=F2E029_HORVV|nr:transcription factor LHW-like isoform X2 [Hordeum vulgare subsp. vulgare]BAK00701.1 predicted protein [Hordeum vulgare subsp. vulgare]